MQNKMDNLSDGKSSLLIALKKFVGAVEVMDETVMVPSRLKDLEVSDSNRPVISESNNNCTSLVLPNVQPGANLYSFYKVLNKLQKEIVSGLPRELDVDDLDSTDSSDDNSENSDPSAEKSAANFKYHLQGLFSSLNQMTDTAKFLTNTYEAGVGQSTRHAHFSSFAN